MIPGTSNSFTAFAITSRLLYANTLTAFGGNKILTGIFVWNILSFPDALAGILEIYF